MTVSLDPTPIRNSVRVDREQLVTFIKATKHMGTGSQLGRFYISRNDARTLFVVTTDAGLVLEMEGNWAVAVNVAAGELMKATGKFAKVPKITIKIDGSFLRIGGVPFRFRKTK